MYLYFGPGLMLCCDAKSSTPEDVKKDMASDKETRKVQDSAKNWTRISGNLWNLSSQVTATQKATLKEKYQTATASRSRST